MLGEYSQADFGPLSYLSGVEYRGFKIFQSRDYFLYEVRTLDDNQPPHSLIGRYTQLGLVQKAIDDYIEKSNSQE